MDFKIVEVFERDCHLVVKVEHYQAGGSFWFLEHYVFQGREGLKRKRMTNPQGELLLNDQSVAPRGVDGKQYLPDGKKWRLRAPPHMDENSILDTIKAVHKQRVVTGWPVGTVDSLKHYHPNDADVAGCAVLVSKFQYLAGQGHIV